MWLNVIAHRTKEFFKRNSNVVAIRSDKGNHTVFLTLEQYDQKITEHLSDRNTYQIIENDPLNEHHTLGRETI